MANQEKFSQPTADLFSTSVVRASQGWKKMVQAKHHETENETDDVPVLEGQQHGQGLSTKLSEAVTSYEGGLSVTGMTGMEPRVSLASTNLMSKSEEELLQEKIFAARMMGAPVTVVNNIMDKFRSNDGGGSGSGSGSTLYSRRQQPILPHQQTPLPPAQQAQARMIAAALFNTIKPVLTEGSESTEESLRSMEQQRRKQEYELQVQETQHDLQRQQQDPEKQSLKFLQQLLKPLEQQQCPVQPQQQQLTLLQQQQQQQHHQQQQQQQLTGLTAAHDAHGAGQTQTPKWSNRAQSTKTKESGNLRERLGKLSSGTSAWQAKISTDMIQQQQYPKVVQQLPTVSIQQQKFPKPEIPTVILQRQQIPKATPEIPTVLLQRQQIPTKAKTTSVYSGLDGPLLSTRSSPVNYPAVSSGGLVVEPPKQGVVLLGRTTMNLSADLQSSQVLQSLKDDGYIDSPNTNKIIKSRMSESKNSMVDYNSTIWPSTSEVDWKCPEPVPKPPKTHSRSGTASGTSKSSKTKSADKLQGRRNSKPQHTSHSTGSFLKGIGRHPGPPKSAWDASVDAFLQSTKRGPHSELKSSDSEDASRKRPLQTQIVPAPVPTITTGFFSSPLTTEIPLLSEVETDKTICSINQRVEQLKQQKAQILQDQMEEFCKEINVHEGTGDSEPAAKQRKTMSSWKGPLSRDKDSGGTRQNKQEISRKRIDDRCSDRDRDKGRDKRRDDERDRHTGTRSPPRKRPSREIEENRSRSQSRHREVDKRRDDHKSPPSPKRSRSGSLEKIKKESSKESPNEIDKRQGRYPSNDQQVTSERGTSHSPERKCPKLDGKGGEIFIDGRWQRPVLKTPPGSSRNEDQPAGSEGKKDTEVKKKSEVIKEKDNMKEKKEIPSKTSEKEHGKNSSASRTTEKREKEKYSTSTKTTEKKEKDRATPTKTMEKKEIDSAAPTKTTEKKEIDSAAPTKSTEKEKKETSLNTKEKSSCVSKSKDGGTSVKSQQSKKGSETSKPAEQTEPEVSILKVDSELLVDSKSSKMATNTTSSSTPQTSTSTVLTSAKESLTPTSVPNDRVLQSTTHQATSGSDAASTKPSALHSVDSSKSTASTTVPSTRLSAVDSANESAHSSADNSSSTPSSKLLAMPSTTASSRPFTRSTNQPTSLPGADGEKTKERKQEEVKLTVEEATEVAATMKDSSLAAEIGKSSIQHQMELLRDLSIEEYVADKVMVDWFCYLCGAVCHSFKLYQIHIKSLKHKNLYLRLRETQHASFKENLVSKLKLLPKKGAHPSAEATVGNIISEPSLDKFSQRIINVPPSAGSGNDICRRCFRSYSCSYDEHLRSAEHKKFEGIRPRCSVCNLIFQKIKQYRKHLTTRAHKQRVATPGKHATTLGTGKASAEDNTSSMDAEKKKITRQKSNVIGSEFITPISGFFCKLCSKFYNNEKTARDVHCATLLHITKTRQYYATRNQSSGTSLKASRGTIQENETSMTAPPFSRNDRKRGGASLKRVPSETGGSASGKGESTKNIPASAFIPSKASPLKDTPSIVASEKPDGSATATPASLPDAVASKTAKEAETPKETTTAGSELEKVKGKPGNPLDITPKKAMPMDATPIETKVAPNVDTPQKLTPDRALPMDVTPAETKPVPKVATPQKPTPQKPTPQKPTPQKPTPKETMSVDAKPAPKVATPHKPTPKETVTMDATPAVKVPVPKIATPQKPTPKETMSVDATPAETKPAPKVATPRKPTPKETVTMDATTAVKWPAPKIATPQKPTPKETMSVDATPAETKPAPKVATPRKPTLKETVTMDATTAVKWPAPKIATPQKPTPQKPTPKETMSVDATPAETKPAPKVATPRKPTLKEIMTMDATPAVKGPVPKIATPQKPTPKATMSVDATPAETKPAPKVATPQKCTPKEPVTINTTPAVTKHTPKVATPQKPTPKETITMDATSAETKPAPKVATPQKPTPKETMSVDATHAETKPTPKVATPQKPTPKETMSVDATHAETKPTPKVATSQKPTPKEPVTINATPAVTKITPKVATPQKPTPKETMTMDVTPAETKPAPKVATLQKPTPDESLLTNTKLKGTESGKAMLKIATPKRDSTKQATPLETTSVETISKETEIKEVPLKVSTLKEVRPQRAASMRTRSRKVIPEEDASKKTLDATPMKTRSGNARDTNATCKEITSDHQGKMPVDTTISIKTLSKEPSLTETIPNKTTPKEAVHIDVISKEILVKEAKAKEAKPNVITFKETSAKETTPEDTTIKEASQNSTTSKAPIKKATPREIMSKQATPKITTHKNVVPEETKPKEAAPNNIRPKDTTPMVSKPKDDTPNIFTKEIIPMGAKPNNLTTEKATPKETTTKETTPKSTTLMIAKPKQTTPMVATSNVSTPKKDIGKIATSEDVTPKEAAPKESEAKPTPSYDPSLEQIISFPKATPHIPCSHAPVTPKPRSLKDIKTTASSTVTPASTSQRRTTRSTYAQCKMSLSRPEIKSLGNVPKKVSDKNPSEENTPVVSAKSLAASDETKTTSQENTRNKTTSAVTPKKAQLAQKVTSNISVITVKTSAENLGEDTHAKNATPKEGAINKKSEKETLAKSDSDTSVRKEHSVSVTPASVTSKNPESTILEVRHSIPVVPIQREYPATAESTSSSPSPKFVKDIESKSPRMSFSPRVSSPSEPNVTTDESREEEYIDVDEIMGDDIIVLDEDSGHGMEGNDDEEDIIIDDDEEDIFIDDDEEDIFIDTIGEVSGDVSGDEEVLAGKWIVEDVDGDEDEEAMFEIPDFGDMFAIDEVGGSDEDYDEDIEGHNVHQVEEWEVLSEAGED